MCRNYTNVTLILLFEHMSVSKKGCWVIQSAAQIWRMESILMNETPVVGLINDILLYLHTGEYNGNNQPH